MNGPVTVTEAEIFGNPAGIRNPKFDILSAPDVPTGLAEALAQLDVFRLALREAIHLLADAKRENTQLRERLRERQ